LDSYWAVAVDHIGTGQSQAHPCNKPRQDGFECKQISRQQYMVGNGRMLLAGSESDFNIWKECLEARGYAVTERRDSDSTSQRTSSNQVVQGTTGCVAANATIGSMVKGSDGTQKRVTALYGVSPRCPVSANPILAGIEDGSSKASPLQLKEVSDPVERLRKWREN